MMRANALPRGRTLLLLASFALGAAALGSACGDDLPSDTTTSTTTGDSTTTTSTTTSSTGGTGGGGTGGGGTGGAPDCYTNPMTHLEIINACTDAQKIDAMPVLPLLEMDGGLPPLP
jgi:hypothetical protein